MAYALPGSEKTNVSQVTVSGSRLCSVHLAPYYRLLQQERENEPVC